MIKVAIFGVGLMGGSLALCFKGKPGIRVAGHSNNPAQVEKYLKRGVVDEASTSMQEVAEDADFIFLCTPVGSLEPYLDKLLRCKLKPGCIVTDVGSTKSSITKYARSKAVPYVHFIGGHPMAGSERSGVEAASSHLYENAYYVLTPDDATPAEAYDRLVELLRHTRAHIVRVDADRHDEIVGAISHLPHVIAVALVNQVAGYNERDGLYQSLAAGGFRDITRIASSHPDMWRDILLNNREVVLALLRDWNAEIAKFADMLERSDGDGIVREFKRAGAFRSQLPERRKGVITSIYDVYVDVPDHPGIIGQIATLLGNSRINLSNIHIIESRADVPGVLRLSFRNETDLEAAIELLKRHRYEVRQ
ncbi:prephenate dehydrogenase [Paenibacillus flagellatus]|uniref:Prephenate dehydrogenase n=1 Tax=Paenibacillus flagellatus TaxID=2211139 RepID=A0A2V5KT91_9BACL|nr:prephenate dehydrogenase [Paenibacillus flagellatus]PYI54907.1 prephenate dehydrogenase [Paenibacillus flagellatus]